jgi:hypothetical protein
LKPRVAALPCRPNSSTSTRRERPTRNENQGRRIKGTNGKVMKNREPRAEPAKFHELNLLHPQLKTKFFPNGQLGP